MDRLIRFNEWFRRHTKAWIVVSFIFVSLWFVFYLYVNVSGEQTGGLEIIGADFKVLERSQQELCQLQSIYPQGRWEKYNPIAPRENNRYSEIFVLPFRCIGPAQWPLVKGAITLSLYLAHLLGIYALYKAFQANGVRVKHFINYVPLLLVSSPVQGTNGYGNIEGILVLFSAALLFALPKRYTLITAGILFFYAITKLQWLALFPGAALALVILAYKRKESWVRWAASFALAVVLAGGLYLLGLILAVNFLGEKYAMAQFTDQFRFFSGTLQNMSFYLSWHQAGVPTDNAVLPTFMNILGVWGMTTYLGPFAVTTWLTVLTYSAGILFFAFHALMLLVYRRNTVPQMTVAFSYLGIFVMMLFLYQLEYATLVTAVYVFLSLEEGSQTEQLDRPKSRLAVRLPILSGLSWRHVLLPYILYQFPQLLYYGTGLEFFNWDNSYLILFSVVGSILLLGWYIRRALKSDERIEVTTGSLNQALSPS